MTDSAVVAFARKLAAAVEPFATKDGPTQAQVDHYNTVCRELDAHPKRDRIEYVAWRLGKGWTP